MLNGTEENGMGTGRVQDAWAPSHYLRLLKSGGFLSCRDEKRHRIRVKSLEDIIHILGRPRVVAAPGAQGATGVPQGETAPEGRCFESRGLRRDVA